MKAAKTLLLACVALSVVACHRHRVRTPKGRRGAPPADVGAAQVTPANPDPAQPQPNADARNPGQIVVDTLTAQGYACTTEETRWACLVPGDRKKWPFYVSYVPQDGQTTIWLDSYIMRAFGQRCAAFENHVQDLAAAEDDFSASCDDGSQRFRLNTSLIFADDLDIPAWTQNHLDHRTNSMTLLDGADAVRR